MSNYQCSELVTTQNIYGSYDCKTWVLVNDTPNFIVELSKLTYADSNLLLSYYIALFASAWVWKRISLHANR